MKFKLNPKYIPILATIVVCIILYVVAGLMYPAFFSLDVLVNFFYDNSFTGIAAVGMTFVILAGGIDLSVGSMLAFVGVFTASMVEKNHLHPFVVLPLALVIGSFLGFIMGCIIHYYKSPPFIVTLAGMFFARGMGNLISLESIPIFHPFFKTIINTGIPLTRDVIFPLLSVIFLMVLGAGIYLAQYTRFGRNVYALGGNEQSAVLLGVPVARTRILVYTLSGFTSALAGVVYTLYTSAGYGLAGSGFELDAIASVVIGGTLITGGVGFVAGTLIGVLIQGVIQTFIMFQGTLSSHWTRIVIGLLLFVFILLQRFLSGMRLSQRDARDESSGAGGKAAAAGQ